MMEDSNLKMFFWLYIESTYSLLFPVRNMNIYEIIIPTAWRSDQVIDSLLNIIVKQN